MISTVENELQFKDVSTKFVDGVELSESQKQYLLPHFLMLLIGKPGSGKTTLLKQLIVNNQMYKQKFDYILLVSPSHAKMGLKVDKKYVTDKFSLDWIYNNFSTINEKQTDKIFGHRMGGKKLVKNYKDATGKQISGKTFVLNDSGNRFVTNDFMKKFGLVDAAGSISDSERKNLSIEQMYKEIQKMPYEEQRRTHCNVLLILDDVVADIKKNENNPQLAQLVMNRRHIIINGTISIVIVSQKYTLIPARVRSNASWLILFQLNPLDFENVYRDVVVEDLRTWREILNFVFGKNLDFNTTSQTKQQKKQDQAIKNSDITTEDNDQEQQQQQEEQKNDDFDMEKYIKNKRYENIGIWIELNMYFKNFKRLTFN